VTVRVAPAADLASTDTPGREPLAGSRAIPWIAVCAHDEVTDAIIKRTHHSARRMFIEI
jgi:hypothetical protein